MSHLSTSLAVVLLILLPTLAIAAPVRGQSQFAVWTDKAVYTVGETVTIQMSPTPGFGVGFWLLIRGPDGSQTRIDLHAGHGTTTIQAGPPTGQYEVELWGQVVYPGATAELEAYCYFDVVGSRSPSNPPILSFNEPQINGLTVTINGVVTPGTAGASITRLNWDWGDGQSVDYWFPASHTFGSGGTYTITVTAYQSDARSTTKSVTVTVSGGQASQASLSVSVSPNPVTIEPGGFGQVSYTFTETNGVGVHVTSRDWVWALIDGSRLGPGSASNDVNVGPRSSASWIDSIGDYPDAAKRSQQLGSDSVTLFTTFHGTDSNGNKIDTEVHLTVKFSQATNGGWRIALTIQLDQMLENYRFDVVQVDTMAGDYSYSASHNACPGGSTSPGPGYFCLNFPSNFYTLESGVPAAALKLHVVLGVWSGGESGSITDTITYDSTVDLTDFPTSEKILSVTLSLDSSFFGRRLYVSSVDPPLSVVRLDTSKDLAITSVTAHEDPVSYWMNLEPVCSLLGLACVTRTYYYDVEIRNPTQYTIALMGVFIGPESSLSDKNWVTSKSQFQVVSAPDHGGEVSKAWRDLNHIAEWDGLAQAYSGGGADAVIHQAVNDWVQDFTHTGNTNTVDMLMADPKVTYQGQDAPLILQSGESATIRFKIEETAYHKGEDFTPSFYAQYVGVTEVVKGLSGWKALGDWVNFLIAADFWSEVNADDVPIVPPAPGVDVPSIPI